MSEHTVDPLSGPEGPVDYERGDVPPGAIVRFALILLVCTGVVAGVVLFMMLELKKFEASQDEAPPPLAIAGERQAMGPPLQTDAFQDLATFRHQEHEILNSYGWVDRQRGIVRVPIQDAMRMFLQQQSTPQSTVDSGRSVSNPVP